MMRLPKCEVLWPGTTEEACSVLDRYPLEAKVIAGGTDLIPAAKLRNVSPKVLISLKRIGAVKGIFYDEAKGLTIGAMTSLREVRRGALIRQHCPSLSDAAASVGSPPIQSMGTLGGNLLLNTRCFYYNQSVTWRRAIPSCLKMGGDVCHVIPHGRKCYAVFSADTPAVLIAAKARVKLVSAKGTRTVPVQDLYSGNGQNPTTIKAEEILTEIQIPPAIHQVSTYVKYRLRKSIDFPLVAVAANVRWDEDNDCCREARIVLNAVGPAPIELTDAGRLLQGSRLDADVLRKAAAMASESAHPVANVGSTPSYRRKMTSILTEKALRQIVKRLRPTGRDETLPDA